MRIIKKINNNVAVAVDSAGHELIVLGKGLGFPKMPYELNDLSRITRTFYDADNKYYGLLNEIPENIILLTADLADFIKNHVDVELNPNLVMTLADHINFAVQRDRENINIDLPYSYDLEFQYPQIHKLGSCIVKRINKELDTHLRKGEITSISLHIINAMKQYSQQSSIMDDYEEIQEKITNLIEQEFQITMNRDSYDYYRFATHVRYFLKRFESQGQLNDSTDQNVFNEMKNSHPDVYQCALKVDQYFADRYSKHCTQDELLYLMLHITKIKN